MRLPRECYQMQQVIETHLPHLSRSQLARAGLVGVRDYPGRERLVPSPPLSPPRETGTICGSAFGNGSTTAATGRVPARPNWM